MAKSNSQDVYKRRAAEHAVGFIEAGMILGLGHGSTAIHAARKIASLYHSGKLQEILGIPCSRFMEGEARKLGIPLTTLEDHPIIDITIDGADEVDDALNLIKGGGGALLREKIVAQASRREVIVVDESKIVEQLGETWPIPVEVTPFGYRTQVIFLETLGAEVTLRPGPAGDPFNTDQGNWILDCAFGPITDIGFLNEKLEQRVGIVEHGLFIGLATDVIIVGEAGLTHWQRP